jgi:hypothetical protein
LLYPMIRALCSRLCHTKARKTTTLLPPTDLRVLRPTLGPVHRGTYRKMHEHARSVN